MSLSINGKETMKKDIEIRNDVFSYKVKIKTVKIRKIKMKK